MNTIKINVKVIFVSLLLLSVVLAACTTQFLDLPILDPSNKVPLIEAEHNITIYEKFEAEDGYLHQTGTYDPPGVFTSGAASGGKFVKNISYKAGYVEVTVPSTFTAGAYNLLIVWSGCSTGSVDITINATDPESTGCQGDFYKNVPFGIPASDWEFTKPQDMLVEIKDYVIKAGDKIRLNNGLAEGLSGPFDGNDPGGHIHVDVLYLYKPN
jgi:hypothetical protein